MSETKKRAKVLIDSLSEEDVEVLIEVAERLASWEATQELLQDPEMVEAIRRGLEQIARGETVPLEELRRRAQVQG